MSKTRKDLGVECRHDIRPAVLGVTTVRSSFQSGPEPPALEPPPSKHDGRFLLRFLTFGDLDLLPFQLKNDTPFARALGTFISVSTFPPFLLSSNKPVWDRRTDGRARGVMRPGRPPHNNDKKAMLSQENRAKPQLFFSP